MDDHGPGTREPASITAVQPAGEGIAAETDGTLDCSAVANTCAPGHSDLRMAIDTGPSRSTTMGQFRLPPLPAGTHKLTVVAVSPGPEERDPNCTGHWPDTTISASKSKT